ncbi:PREDICTED: protein starmaker-like isoform X2 [Camelina sativa]|uniref:Protein starmaker-like isoform X2 n=1 Tax=Camelina sativa TaxID=90675 RepID=A0ABM0Z733_CAMSA|nr:PREDICTED: protein starmaker-like isoform X2 [Camelina sativa]
MEKQREESEFVGDSMEEEEEAGKGLGLSSKTETLDDGEDTNNTVQVSDSDVDNLVSDVKADDDDDDDDVEETKDSVGDDVALTDAAIDGDAEVEMNGETAAKSQIKSAGEGESVISGVNEVTADDNARFEVEDNGDVHTTEKSQLTSVDAAEMLSVAEKKSAQEKQSTNNIKEGVDSKQENEENVGSETKDTVLEVGSAAEVNNEGLITNEEEKGEAMEIDYAAEEQVEDDVKVGEALDIPPVAEAVVVTEMAIDEPKDNADMATETIVSTDLANPNSPSDDAAPGNIQDLKTDTRNVSFKEDKKAATVAIENGSSEAPVASGAQSPAAATDCSKEASDAILGSGESKDHECLDTKTTDQQDTVREEEDIITHESQSIDPNRKEDTGMEEDPSNSDFADDEAGSDVKTNGVKRKADVLSEDSPGEGTKTVSLAKVSFAERPSFKIGACIARAASQMTGSSLVLKGGSNCDDETLSVESFVSQLHCAATDPDKENVVSEIAAGFFLDFRNSSALQQDPPEKVGKKRGRPSNSDVAGTEAFEFEEMGDTYWTDRVIHNGGEEQTPPTEKGNYQVVPVELKPAQVQRTRRPYKRRQTQIHIPLSVSDKPANFDENAPAELVMKFSEADTIPPEKSLSKMFRHFGPIRESQTEVDKENNRARVVYRKGADAKVAYNSAGRFSIFGTKAVNYELSYTITETFKLKPYVVSLGEEDAAPCLPA